MIDAATTRAQHAKGHINLKLEQLDRDLAAVQAGIAAGSLTRPQAAVWCRLLVEATGDAVADLLIFATRGTP